MYRIARFLEAIHKEPGLTLDEFRLLFPARDVVAVVHVAIHYALDQCDPLSPISLTFGKKKKHRVILSHFIRGCDDAIAQIRRYPLDGKALAHRSTFEIA